VIRNEWRNGGYPAWLLTRPEYGMPLHDILEGRYPATATLQNANSDDAAAQWLGNATHMTYATRWLRAVLREFAPVAADVIAVQLDDDQGAYIDNQTWPAPHLQTYLRTLEATVRDVVGPRLPVFINTYEMKVTAAAPVWAMGNWYQSDAYAIGEHDRAALEFSAGLLQTQTAYPLAISEFQAGWLAPPEDPQPRPADPTNTTLALHTLLGMGMRGAIDFPAQDTVNPAGWEAPFANMSYAWGAALDVNLDPSPRYAPTRRFGDLVRRYGSELAGARRVADGAIAYLTSAYDAAQITNADVFAIAARTQTAQHGCRAHHLVCDLVDLRFASDGDLRRYPFIVVPAEAVALPLTDAAAGRLRRYRQRGGRVVSEPPGVVTPHTGGLADATLLAGNDGAAFLDIVNYDGRPRAIPATQLHLPGGDTWAIGPFTLAARDAVLLRRERGQTSAARHGTNAIAIAAATVSTRLSPSATVGRAPSPPEPSSPSPGQTAPTRVGADASAARARVTVDDRGGDGLPRVTLSNGRVSMTLAPDAGGRAFTFAAAPGGCHLINAFTSVGALRDDVSIQPPLSTSDRIGKYTRSFPTGMFNRPYLLTDVSVPGGAAITLRYDAPDVVPAGARFERTLSLRDGDDTIDVRERTIFGSGPQSALQRAVRYDSFDTRGVTTFDEHARGAVGFFFPAGGCVAIVAWPAGDVEDAQLIPERTSAVLRLQFAPDRSTLTRYRLAPAADAAAARAVLDKLFSTGAIRGLDLIRYIE
jgi:hypothetical protein